MDLSILIPTLTSRQKQHADLIQWIENQIAASSAPVEVLSFQDDGTLSIGSKRNHLLEQAQGKFTVFIDDDDWISADYIELICGAIQRSPELDCVGFQGEITFSGSHPHPVVYSLQHRHFRKKEGVYQRPLMHINPIRREIARAHKFENINYSEDIDWAMRLQRDDLLRNEVFIENPLYFYRSRRKWWYQTLIDGTEVFRQALGIQVHNLVRIRRALRRA